jgi:hypothetical protein
VRSPSSDSIPSLVADVESCTGSDDSAPALEYGDEDGEDGDGAGEDGDGPQNFVAVPSSVVASDGHGWINDPLKTAWCLSVADGSVAATTSTTAVAKSDSERGERPRALTVGTCASIRAATTCSQQ